MRLPYNPEFRNLHDGRFEFSFFEHLVIVSDFVLRISNL